MNYGTYARLAQRLIIRRGYAGNEPTNKSFSAPVTAATTIYSGQLISLTSGAWVLGCTAGKTPYLAFHDSTDPDVLSAGLLLGISLSGNYVFETPWFTAAAGSFLGNDIALKADTGSTVLTPGSFSGAGCITLASSITDTADVVGITSNGGYQNTTAINSEGTAAGSPPVTATIVFDALWSPTR